MRQLALEGGAPRIGIGARAVALVAHVLETGAQLCYELVGAVALLRRRVTLLASLLLGVAGNGRVDAMHFGRVDLPLAMLVAEIIPALMARSTVDLLRPQALAAVPRV